MSHELTAEPLVSIVIPVYNEEAILHAAVVDLREKLTSVRWTYEILIAENGSTDRTVIIGQQLADKYGDVRLFSLGEPNYGKALRKGIVRARGKYVICDEIDLCDTEFHQAAIGLLQREEADLVIGSKLLSGSSDERPWARNFASRVYNGLLRAVLGFRGTDTHGLKAFHRERLLDIVNACVVDKDVFASEFVIRADRARIPMREIPVRVIEKRPPSINLIKRVPTVMRQVGKLAWAIRVR